ncbi:hypothetical protein BDZ97DRAFT_75041 [Flammula alnicola]|nr:hypothetical protein BDZ97DRAFT_75041 [Flammula alnicola]
MLSTIGSHYHFIETNPALSFDHGKHIENDRTSQQEPRCDLSPEMWKLLHSFQLQVQRLSLEATTLRLESSTLKGWPRSMQVWFRKASRMCPNLEGSNVAEDMDIGRELYILMLGPTVGDRDRFGDTALWVEVEHDETVYGDEAKFVGGSSSHARHWCYFDDQFRLSGYGPHWRSCQLHLEDSQQAPRVPRPFGVSW